MNLTLCVLLFVSIAVCFAQKYSSKYDNIDIDSILSNRRILDSYIKCLLDQGPCTAEGREFKKDIPDALVNSCAKCTDAQKRIVRKGSKFIMQHRPMEWEQITNHFDPAGKYKNSFLKFINEAQM